MGALLEEISSIGKSAIDAVAFVVDSNDRIDFLMTMPAENEDDSVVGPATKNANIPVVRIEDEIEDGAEPMVAKNNSNEATDDEDHDDEPAPVVIGSNDHVDFPPPLTLSVPDDSAFGPATKNANIPVPNGGSVEIEDAQSNYDEDDDDRKNGPCSNDNPEYHMYTVDCPGAVITGMFDDIIEEEEAKNGDLLVASEFESTTTTTTMATVTSVTSGTGAGFVASNDVAVVIGDTVIGENDNDDVASNDATDIMDGDDASNDNDADLIDGKETSGNDDPANASPPPVDDGDETDNAANEEKDNDVQATTAIYPSFYSCSADAEDELANNTDTGDNNNAENEELSFAFDYEMYTSPSVEIDVVLESFERQLAHGVASSLGLADCPPDDAAADAVSVEIAFRSTEEEGGGGWTRRNRRRSLQPAGAAPWVSTSGGGDRSLLNDADEGSTVAGLSMYPVDRLDTTLPGCTSSVTLDAPSKCSPIVGAMTAWIATTAADPQRRHYNLRRHLIDTKEERGSMTMLLQDAVRTYIAQNGDDYLNDDLLHVAYVGTDTRSSTASDTGGNPTQVIDINAPEGETGGGAQQRSQMSQGLVALFVTMALLASLIVGTGAMLYRRRLRNGRRRRDADRESGLHLDLERHHGDGDAGVGAFPALTPESESVVNPSSGDVYGGGATRDYGPSGLVGVESDAAIEDGEVHAPSTLAVFGAASAVVRELSYRSPSSRGGGVGGCDDGRDATPVPPNNTPESNAPSMDVSPVAGGGDNDVMMPESNNSSEDNMEPMTPMGAAAGESISSYDDMEEDSASGVSDTTEEEYDEYGSPVMQRDDGAFPSMDGSAPRFDDATPAAPQVDVGGDDDYDDDDESDLSGVMV